MQLTGELKEKVEKAENKEEAKKILGETKQNVEEAGVILDDEDLDKIAGGGSTSGRYYDYANSNLMDGLSHLKRIEGLHLQ